jgi:hypothetical protein
MVEKHLKLRLLMAETSQCNSLVSLGFIKMNANLLRFRTF